MNEPHHEILEFVVDDFVCQFDGDRWVSTDERLADTLNLALRLCPQPQSIPDPRQLAERCLRMADYGGRYRVTSAQKWPLR